MFRLSTLARIPISSCTHRLALSTNIGIFSLIFSISTAVVEFSCDAAIPSDFSDCYQIPLWRPLLYLMLGFALLHTMLPNSILVLLLAEEHGAVHTWGAFNAGFVLSMGGHNGPGLHKGARLNLYSAFWRSHAHCAECPGSGGARGMWRLPLIWTLTSPSKIWTHPPNPCHPVYNWIWS